MQQTSTTGTDEIAVIGGGPAGLMAAQMLAEAGHRVCIYDQMPSIGRKFLMAGRGGLNLTHSEALDRFMARYGAGRPLLEPAIAAFSPQDVRDWAQALGQETFVGSSGRVFPKAFKASPLLRAWLRQLDGLGVRVALRHRLTGFEGGVLSFETPQGPVRVRARATILAMGGASWPRLGSDGSFAPLLSRLGVGITPLLPSNCGLLLHWSDVFLAAHEGAPLKRIALSYGGALVRGEMIVTRNGLEGGSIYALSAAVRDGLLRGETAVLDVDLRPDLAMDELARKLALPRGKQSLSSFLRKAAGLTPVAIGLMWEGARAAGQNMAQMDGAKLASLIKQVPLRITGFAGLERAISSAGGVRAGGLDAAFMLKALPGVFVAGEMLDWEAPTGGYLLQGCFASGRAAGLGAAAWLKEKAL